MLKKILFLFNFCSLLAICSLISGCAIKVDSPTNKNGGCIPKDSTQVNTTLIKT